MRKVRWGVLSTAQIAREFLLPALDRAENAHIAAIASANPVVDKVASTFGISTIYRTYEELLEGDQIDAVYIPLPNALHAEWVKNAAKKGKHVLCEKPAALTVKEAEEMLAVCMENKVLFLEGFMYQFHPQHQRVREIIESGEIGKSRRCGSAYRFKLDDQDAKSVAWWRQLVRCRLLLYSYASSHDSVRAGACSHLSSMHPVHKVRL